MQPVRVAALKVAVAGLCGYELTALAGAPWPTVTHVVHTHRSRSRACRIAVWAGLGGLAWHLLVEGSRAR